MSVLLELVICVNNARESCYSCSRIFVGNSRVVHKYTIDTMALDHYELYACEEHSSEGYSGLAEGVFD